MTGWVIAFVCGALGQAPASEAGLPSSLDIEPLRAVVVQVDGRWPPLDTLARDTVEQVTGSAVFQGHDPVLMLLAWTFAPTEWEDQPLISIGNAALRQELELSPTREVFSFNELVNHDRFMSLLRQLEDTPPGHKPDALELKVADIRDQLVLLQRSFAGDVIRLIPHPTDKDGWWMTISQTASAGEYAAVHDAWAKLGQAFLDGDAPGFAATSAGLTGALAALPAAHRPAPSLIDVELRYNRLQPFRLAWMVMVVGVVLATAALLVPSKAIDVLAALAMLAGFAVLTYGLWLRWQIAGRIPASNMFESLLFLSWGVGAFAVVSLVFMRSRGIPLVASAMGALSLVLAERLLPHYIRPIVPVLQDTFWMTIHVPVIMVSYSVLAIAMFIAHTQLAVMAVAPKRRDLIVAIDGWHYWCVFAGVVLLFAGIATGSMWGASSWGRYWGWDPKEVWSLVALLGYLTILHVRVDVWRQPLWAYALGVMMIAAMFRLVIPHMGELSMYKVLAFAGIAAAVVMFVVGRGQFATALKSVLCFWLVLMTYVGVNYVLGTGLHSYGFGKGAVAWYMLLVGAIDLGLVGLLCAVYVVRTPSPSASVATT